MRFTLVHFSWELNVYIKQIYYSIQDLELPVWKYIKFFEHNNHKLQNYNAIDKSEIQF